MLLLVILLILLFGGGGFYGYRSGYYGRERMGLRAGSGCRPGHLLRDGWRDSATSCISDDQCQASAGGSRVSINNRRTMR